MLLVGVGAFVGGIARYAVGLWFVERFGTAFPYGTLAVNVSGSFLLAFLLALVGGQVRVGPELYLLLGVGFCGGYTTFSTFAFESLALIETRAMAAATLNIVVSVALSLLATLAGLWLGRFILP
jgi:CrcB protein